MKRKIALTSLIFLMFFTTGCWNRMELDQRPIVAGFGVDKAEEEGKIKVTVQIVKPGEIKAGPAAKGGGPKAVTIHTDTGHTFFDTFRNMAMVVGQKLFLTEAKIVVVGEDLAREGIGKITDFYDRDHEPSTRNFLLIAKGEAKEVLVTEVGTGAHPGLVHIFSAMETCTSYKPWHDKKTGKTFVKTDLRKMPALLLLLH